MNFGKLIPAIAAIAVAVGGTQFALGEEAREADKQAASAASATPAGESERAGENERAGDSARSVDESEPEGDFHRGSARELRGPEHGNDLRGNEAHSPDRERAGGVHGSDVRGGPDRGNAAHAGNGPSNGRGGAARGNGPENARPDFFGSDLPAPPPPGAFSKEEAGLIRSVFMMSDSELRTLRTLIERLERIPAEHRRRLAEDLARASSEMTDEQRETYMRDVRNRFRRTQNNLLARHFAELPPDEADAERKKFLALDGAGRRQYLSDVREKMGYAPLPPSARDRRPGEASESAEVSTKADEADTADEADAADADEANAVKETDGEATESAAGTTPAKADEKAAESSAKAAGSSKAETA